jgi:hypothetical protein
LTPLAIDNRGIAMAKKRQRPQIKKVCETFFGKQLADPKASQRHAQIVQQLRDDAKDELAMLERSERLSKEDFAVVINARTDDIHFSEEAG